MNYRNCRAFCLMSLLVLALAACSESEDTQEEYANWQAVNTAETEKWAGDGKYRKIVAYTKDDTSTATSSDFIYVEVLESGDGEDRPIYTDTCRVSYRGTLLPSRTYSSGFVFDQNYLGDYDERTAGASDFKVSATTIGFATALMNMHVGDHWRVYVPYQLGYGATAQTTIPAYSNLIFEIVLQDYWHIGQEKPAFRGRRR